VLVEQRGDLRDAEHEHEIEEQLDERDPLIVGRYDGERGGHVTSPERAAPAASRRPERASSAGILFGEMGQHVPRDLVLGDACGEIVRALLRYFLAVAAATPDAGDPVLAAPYWCRSDYSRLVVSPSVRDPITPPDTPGQACWNGTSRMRRRAGFHPSGGVP
jgi:hypothetical protein